MKQFRGLTTIFISSLLVFTMIGCGNNTNNVNSSKAETASSETSVESETDTAAVNSESVIEQTEQLTETMSETETKSAPEATENNQAKPEPELIVTGYKVSHSEEYTDLGVTVKNNTDFILCTPTITVGTLDEANNILDTFELQAMVALFPGQTITLSEFRELGDATSFFVDSSGWVEYADEIYDVDVGGHLDAMSLEDGSEVYTDPEKSSVNCLDSDIVNEDSGHDIGVTIQEMSIEDEGYGVTLYATIKNETDQTISDVTTHASLMDSEGNILKWSMMQELVDVEPGQSIRLSDYEDLEGLEDLEYFTISYCAFDIGDDYYSGYIKTIPQAASK